MASSSQKSSPGQLNIPTAPQAAAQAIRESIISGELSGGERIIEQKWAVRLGIGQPTLREALNELTHQGLLRKVPARGTYVTQLSPEDYRLIQEVRIPLEAIAIGKAAENFTPEADAELTALVTAMTGTGMAATDVRHFHDCDVAFHRTIWELAGNEYLRDTLESVTFRLFVFSVVGRWPGNSNALSERLAAVQQHHSILEGLRSRNKDTARQVFVKQTVHYWNTQYGLDIKEDELTLAGLMGESPVKETSSREMIQEKELSLPLIQASRRRGK
ncbi:MAG TPA: GntR family transcriptional regulator [Edaphobacter sp.]|uniref:GntR family transcriptional regulator n=1 Tax=Edaphobacter sp. TaxID=1934404 RepID=UPI002D0C9827|nr:GntR family transcriptional regulator [Edaphobacter sp.]HUZ93521.1 GntR family transcriptional regulator [Edaphobacter sp.]